MRRNVMAGAFLVAIEVGGMLAFSQTEPTEAQGRPAFSLPSRAVQVAPGVFSLGTAIHNGQVVEGYAIAEHKGKEHGKPDGGGGGRGGGETCFAFIANGAEWNTAEPWMIDPGNDAGLTVGTVTNLIAGAFHKWETAAGAEIFGNQIVGVVVGADCVSADDKNEVLFMEIEGTGTIAATIMWGVFCGPPSGRGLTEWDMVYDDFECDWSAEAGGVSGAMDFDNIAVHEVGHAAGMGHPSDACTEETLFRMASEGETKKRNFFDGDKAGILEIY
ncbi:MAG TPA: matrixin family metalloprotease [Dehalococcoidia bacterium]|nr:matrixin family metalloprotease [Dehalococcoidia bacterium]